MGEDEYYMKRQEVVDYDQNGEDELVPTQIQFSRGIHQEIANLSAKIHMSKGAIVREAVDQYLHGKLSPKTNPEAEISDEDVQNLLDTSKSFWGTTATTGSNSIFANFKKYGVKFNELTDSQWILVCHYLQEGYEGFSERPSVEDFIEWANECEPSKEQAKMLKLLLENTDVWEITDEDLKKSVKQITKELEQLEKESEQPEEPEG